MAVPFDNALPYTSPYLTYEGAALSADFEGGGDVTTGQVRGDATSTANVEGRGTTTGQTTGS